LPTPLFPAVSQNPDDAIAIAGSGRGDFPAAVSVFECIRDSDSATIGCQRWYGNGTSGKEWYCAQTVGGAPVAANFAIDPLLSQAGRLVLTSALCSSATTGEEPVTSSTGPASLPLDHCHSEYWAHGQSSPWSPSCNPAWSKLLISSGCYPLRCTESIDFGSASFGRRYSRT